MLLDAFVDPSLFAMALDRPSSSSSSAATLDDLRLFLSHVAEPGWHTFYSADIGLWSGKFSVTMKRKYVSASGSSVFKKDRKEETSRTFRENLDLLDVIRTMVEYPTWSRGDFVFNDESDFVPELDDLLVKLFSLLGSSRSLSTVHIMFYRFYHTHLPRLLGELRFLETLVLDACPMSLPEHAESIAAFLEHSHSTLKSCTLVLNSCDFQSDSHSVMRTILRPFTNGAALKELVIRITPPQRVDEVYVCKKLVCPNCHEAMADMLRHNISLVKFELACSYSRDNVCALVGSALQVNHSLQEFGFPCTGAGLLELGRSLSGPQANTSLSTLKLFPSSDCRGVEFMEGLATFLRINNTLKAVVIAKQSDGNSWPAWESENLTAPKHVERMTWTKLKLMMEDELRVNTTLNSLVVGNWTLLRVDTGWDLSYEGPCLSTLKNIAGETHLLSKLVNAIHGCCQQ